MSSLPWRDGNYRGENMYADLIQMKGQEYHMTGMVHRLEAGQFGAADPALAAATGQQENTLKLCYSTAGEEYAEYGVISEDGNKLTFKNMVGVGYMEWITEEEAAAIEAAKEPMEAPSHPYKEQPDNPGKLLWITGPPGLGKSTTAQLLAKTAGYVYYEGDCFGMFKNPFIPLEAAEPSLASTKQKPLKGEGMAERMEIVNAVQTEYEKRMAGQEYDKDGLLKYYGIMCEDIKQQRVRLGGNWAVAALMDTKEFRAFARTKLPEVVFVVLEMSLSDQAARLAARQPGDEAGQAQLQAVYALCEPAGPGEEGAVSVAVQPGDTVQQVADRILDLVKNNP